jgi:hypothetical protein
VITANRHNAIKRSQQRGAVAEEIHRANLDQAFKRRFPTARRSTRRGKVI